MDMAMGHLVGKGRTAEVFGWGTDKVLKLYYEWVPASNIDYEAGTTDAAHKSGAPAPACFGPVEWKNRKGLLFERIVGEPMLDILKKNPWKAASCGRDMARLHLRIHSAAAGGKLPLQGERFEKTIRASECLPAVKIKEVMRYLYSLPESSRVCHGDLHPGNILAAPEGSAAIDWNNAYSGNPLGDVARSFLIMQSPSVLSFVAFPTPLLLFRIVQSRLCSSYLKEYLRHSGARFAEIDAWMLPVAAARLADKMPGEEAWLMGILNERLG